MGGNLYVEDSGKPTIQLTNSGQDRMPVFSDDGEKIVFYRGPMPEKNQVYVISMDGIGERKLVTPDLLAMLGLGYDEFTELYSLAFVPNTHQVLFNTYHRNPVTPLVAIWEYSHSGDLLIVNTDTGQIKQLVTPGKAGNFLVSPNGKRIAI